MTLDERVEKLSKQLGPLTNPEFCSIRAKIIRRALIEQDKITRHAAADEVAKLTAIKREVSHYYNGQISMTIREFKDAAHSAVMSCRGGVK